MKNGRAAPFSPELSAVVSIASTGPAISHGSEWMASSIPIVARRHSTTTSKATSLDRNRPSRKSSRWAPGSPQATRRTLLRSERDDDQENAPANATVVIERSLRPDVDQRRAVRRVHDHLDLTDLLKTQARHGGDTPSDERVQVSVRE